MDRTESFAALDRAAVRAVSARAEHLLLPAGGREFGESRVDACDRRAVFTNAFLRQSQAGGSAERQSKARSATDACDGHRSNLPAAANDLARYGAPDLPVFTAECGGHEARPGVGRRHHLRAIAAWVLIPRGRDGLVQPVRAQLALVEHVHGQLLEGAPGLFEDGRGRRGEDPAAPEEELYEQIGRLKMEVEWLKKKATELT